VVDWSDQVKHSEHKYLDLGYRFEKARSPASTRSVAAEIRALLESETIEDRAEARHLVERGRQEARAIH
jgi:hypothetical protein